MDRLPRMNQSPDDAVMVEFDLPGTNLGEIDGLPPTGEAFASAGQITHERGELLALAGRLGDADQTA